MQTVNLSTVTPVYRGSEYLPRLIAELEDLREKLNAGELPLRLVECVFVLDEPIDNSADLLGELAESRSWVRVIQLSRNVGQHPATIAGILHTVGDWVVTLDEDLQHDPRHILPMLRSAVEKGHDVVYAQPRSQVHRQRWRDHSSRLAKRVIAWMTDCANAPLFNSFRVIRGSVARAAGSLASHSTYLDVLLSWFTARVTSLELGLVDPRESESGYSVARLFGHAWRLLLSSRLRGLRICLLLGVGAVGLSAVGGLAILLLRLLAPETIALQGWASIMMAILFFGGFAALLASLALDYLVAMYQASMGKPTFFVVDRSGDRILAEQSEDAWSSLT